MTCMHNLDYWFSNGNAVFQYCFHQYGMMILILIITSVYFSVYIRDELE